MKVKIEEIKKLIEQMKIFYCDGEIKKGKKYLQLTIQKDKAGKDGYIYGWSLLKSNGEEEKGDAFLYSEEELLRSLKDNGIIY